MKNFPGSWCTIVPGMVLSLICMTVIGCSSKVLPPEVVRNDVVATTTVLATMPEPGKQLTPDAAQSHTSGTRIVFDPLGRSVAYISEHNGMQQVFFNGKKIGKPYKSIGYLVISPGGSRVAYCAQVKGEKWRMVRDGVEGQVFEEVGEPVFSSDGKHVAYGAHTGAIGYIVIDERLSGGIHASIKNLMFSPDSQKITYVEADNEKQTAQLIISDLKFKPLLRTQFGNTDRIQSKDKTRIAAVCKIDGKQKVVEFNVNSPDKVSEGTLYDFINDLAYGTDGVSLVYVIKRGENRFLVFNGKEELLPVGGSTEETPVIRPDGKGVIISLANNLIYTLHQVFFRDSSLFKKSYKETATMVFSKDGRQNAYLARNDESTIVVVNGNEGPKYDKIVTPMFSPDGTVLVYRVRKDGKRFVVVSDTNGRVMREHPRYEMVFETVFTADGKSVAYGVKDGSKLIWKVEKL
jgi:WD40 repeat protein